MITYKKPNGTVKEFKTAKELDQYLEAQNPKPKKKRKKKVEYKAIEEDGETKDNTES